MDAEESISRRCTRSDGPGCIKIGSIEIEKPSVTKSHTEMTDEERAVERWENEGGKRLALGSLGEERIESQFGKVVAA